MLEKLAGKMDSSEFQLLFSYLLRVFPPTDFLRQLICISPNCKYLSNKTQALPTIQNMIFLFCFWKINIAKNNYNVFTLMSDQLNLQRPRKDMQKKTAVPGAQEALCQYWLICKNKPELLQYTCTDDLSELVIKELVSCR